MALPIPGLHGAYRRSELVQQFGRRWVTNALANNVIRPLWRGMVVVESRRLLDPWTRCGAALLAAGPEAVIAGASAAALHGCQAIDNASTHVVLPYEHRIRSRPGLTVHHGRFFQNDVIDLDGLAVLPLDRVIADLLCTAGSQDALAVTDEALRLARTEHDVLRKRIADRLRRRQDPRGTVRGAALLDLASERAASPAESWLRMMILDLGAPIPEVNWPILAPDGCEIYRLDLAWPNLRIVLEYDGYSTHVDRTAPDEVRADDLRKRGWIVVRAQSADLRNHHRLLTELRAAFARRGYTW